MSAGKSKSKSKSASAQSSFVDPAQQAFLQRLYSGAEDTFNRVDPLIQPAAERFGREAQVVNRQMTGRQRQIAGGSNPFIQSLLQRSQESNPFLQANIDAMGSDIGRFTQEALQGVGSGFASANQFGSGRQGQAEGSAIGRGIEEFAGASAQMRTDDLYNQTGAATAGAGLQLAASQAAQQGAQNQFELGLAPILAQFSGLAALSGLLGDPTVIGSGTSSGKGSSSGFSFGIG